MLALAAASHPRLGVFAGLVAFGFLLAIIGHMIRSRTVVLTGIAVIGVMMGRSWMTSSLQAYVPTWYASLGYPPSFYGPLTTTLWSLTSTFTFYGTGRGSLPIRDITQITKRKPALRRRRRRAWPAFLKEFLYSST